MSKDLFSSTHLQFCACLKVNVVDREHFTLRLTVCVFWRPGSQRWTLWSQTPRHIAAEEERGGVTILWRVHVITLIPPSRSYLAVIMGRWLKGHWARQVVRELWQQHNTSVNESVFLTDNFIGSFSHLHRNSWTMKYCELAAAPVI